MKFLILSILVSYQLSQLTALDGEGISRNCGSSLVRQGHHLGGPRLFHGKFPWTAGLLLKDKDKFFCGGTLISNKEVITAAHCIESSHGHNIRAEDMKVLLGFHNISNPTEPARRLVSVSKIRIHPDWIPVSMSFDADIAILELAEEVIFTRYIQPICLTEPGSDIAAITEGGVASFGVDDNQKVEDVLRLLDSSIDNFKKCSKSPQISKLLSHRTLCSKQLDGNGLCFGDGGFGLMVSRGSTYYLRGIVSASLITARNRCDDSMPSVITDITKFYGWILNENAHECNDPRMLSYIKQLEDENKALKSALYR